METEKAKILKDYAYTPFDKLKFRDFELGKFLFYILILGFLVFILTAHKMLQQNIFDKIPFIKNNSWITGLIYFLPILIIIYYDTRFSTFSLKNIICNIFPFINEETFSKINPSLNYILRVIGAYGIIQVLAQDFGIKTGKRQSELTKPEIIQWIIYTGTAYSLVNNRSEAMIASTIYFILKHVISNGETKPVCFDDV